MKVIIWILVVLLIIGLYYAFKKIKEEDIKNTWVDNTTGEKYSIFLKCKIKNSNNDWVDGFIYHKFGESDIMYISEYKDFVINFRTLEEWEKEHGTQNR